MTLVSTSPTASRAMMDTKETNSGGSMFEEIEKADDGENVLAPNHHTLAFVSFVWDSVDDDSE